MVLCTPTPTDLTTLIFKSIQNSHRGAPATSTGAQAVPGPCWPLPVTITEYHDINFQIKSPSCTRYHFRYSEACPWGSRSGQQPHGCTGRHCSGHFPWTRAAACCPTVTVYRRETCSVQGWFSPRVGFPALSSHAVQDQSTPPSNSLGSAVLLGHS